MIFVVQRNGNNWTTSADEYGFASKSPLSSPPALSTPAVAERVVNFSQQETVNVKY